ARQPHYSFGGGAASGAHHFLLLAQRPVRAAQTPRALHVSRLVVRLCHWRGGFPAPAGLRVLIESSREPPHTAASRRTPWYILHEKKQHASQERPERNDEAPGRCDDSGSSSLHRLRPRAALRRAH